MMIPPNRARLPMMWPPPDEHRMEEDWQFYVETITSWRAWRVIDLDGILLLQSITHRVNWTPRQEFIAECRPSGKYEQLYRSHPSPDPSHGCGIYSVKESDAAKQWCTYPGPSDTSVYGQVSIWGHVHEFTLGYLSEFAYPSKLFVPKKLGTLGVEVGQKQLSSELSKTYLVEAISE